MTERRILNGIAHPSSPAGDQYRARIATGAKAHHHKAIAGSLNLHNYGGKTIPALTFVNLYAGGAAAWQASDRSSIDSALGAAMSDAGLNNVMAQYFDGTPPTSTMLPSEAFETAGSTSLTPVPSTVGKDTVEGWVTAMHDAGQLPGHDYPNTVYCFMLPSGIVLTDGPASGGASAQLSLDPDAADSKHGLGGYHGSAHVGGDTVYYAIGVHSDANNGIDAFPGNSWKNVVATFYHELNEARTDADVEDASNASTFAAGEKFLGWYSPRAGEVGDIPITEAGTDLSSVFVEVPLTADPSAKVPIQLMWSNDDGAPEGPVSNPEPASS